MSCKWLSDNVILTYMDRLAGTMVFVDGRIAVSFAERRYFHPAYPRYLPAYLNLQRHHNYKSRLCLHHLKLWHTTSEHILLVQFS